MGESKLAAAGPGVQAGKISKMSAVNQIRKHLGVFWGGLLG